MREHDQPPLPGRSRPYVQTTRPDICLPHPAQTFRRVHDRHARRARKNARTSHTGRRDRTLPPSSRQGTGADLCRMAGPSIHEPRRRHRPGTTLRKHDHDPRARGHLHKTSVLSLARHTRSRTCSLELDLHDVSIQQEPVSEIHSNKKPWQSRMALIFKLMTPPQRQESRTRPAPFRMNRVE